MTEAFTAFVYFGLPVSIVVLCWAAVKMHERHLATHPPADAESRNVPKVLDLDALDEVVRRLERQRIAGVAGQERQN
jgi:hypothetical protein